jgi:MoaA/NifB/PqqE/SkfB family radical SAM enzyme
MNNPVYIPQEISKGSAHVTSNLNYRFNRTTYMIENMESNGAYKSYLDQKKIIDTDFKILDEFKNRYREYRKNWKEQPISAYEKININKSNNELLKEIKPLCIDIETASICDLACPHCYREYLITPDKIMDENLYKKIIDEISDLKIPSIKLNWRGEPLLNPKIYDFIKYAKKKNILEVSINTNATQLNEKNSIKLLESGIDLVIFSFDGGVMNTYEKMRPGRFKKNSFKEIYNNIKNFCELKKKKNLKFPITKIQMVLTEDSRGEIKEFYQLFQKLIDDVTVTQYQERGGNIDDLKDNHRIKLNNYIEENKLNRDTPYMVSPEGKIFVSYSRKPCEQLFQRLMITYNGKVGMCCHDWGAKHPVGYIDERGYDDSAAINKVSANIKKNTKGFSLLKNAKVPEEYNYPEKTVENIIDIWKGEELNKVRKLHAKKGLSQLKICKNCSFKETYTWKNIE